MKIFIGICTFIFFIAGVTTDDVFKIFTYLIGAAFGLCYLFGYIQL